MEEQLQQETPGYTEYMPWLEQSDQIILKLKALGLSKAQISRVLSGDVAEVEGEIIDPDTGYPQLIPMSKVKLVKTDACKKVEIQIDNLPIPQFFMEYYERQAYLKKYADKDPLFAELFEENMALRRQLGGKARTYK